MTEKQWFLRQIVLNLCNDVHGPAFMQVEWSRATGPRSNLFPITVVLDGDFVGPANVKKVYKTVADLASATIRACPGNC